MSDEPYVLEETPSEPATDRDLLVACAFLALQSKTDDIILPFRSTFEVFGRLDIWEEAELLSEIDQIEDFDTDVDSEDPEPEHEVTAE